MGLAYCWRALPALLMASVSLHLFAAEPSLVVPSYNQFSDEEEIKIGKAASQEFESRYELVDNAVLGAYLSNLTNRLAERSRRPELKYSCKVLNTQEVGALSFPGGYIYVTRGLLEFAQTESELAWVISHEIGHLAGRHLLNRFALELRSRSLWESAKRTLPLLDNSSISRAFQSMGLPIVNVLASRYDAANESEADLLAFYNLMRAGWNPAGELRVLDRSQQPPAGRAWFANWLAEPPTPSDRSRLISAELAGVTVPSGAADDSLAFKSMKLGMDILPRPRH